MLAYAIIVLLLALLCLSLYRLVLLRWAAARAAGEGSWMTLASAGIAFGLPVLAITAPMLIMNAMMQLLPQFVAPAAAGLAGYILGVLVLTAYTRHQVDTGRSVSRRGSVVSVLLLTVLLVCFVIGRNLQVQRQLAADLKASEEAMLALQPTSDPSAPNAADAYWEVFAHWKQNKPANVDWVRPQMIKRSATQPAATSPATPEDQEQEEELVEDTRPDLVRAPDFPTEHQRTIDQLREISRLRRCQWLREPQHVDITTKIPWLSELREMANTLRWHALSEARAGRVDQAVEDINAIRRVGDHAANPPFLITALVQISIHSLAISTVEEILPTVKDPRVLDQISLPPSNWSRAVMVRALRGERATSATSIAMLLRGDLGLTDIGIPAFALPVYRIAAGNHDLQVYSETLRRIADDLEAGRSQPMPGEEILRIRQQGLILAIFLPSLNTALQLVDRAQAAELCLVAGLAAKRYQLEKGQLPNALEDLVQSGYLKEVPLDPFGGQPLRTKRQANEFWIYSIGPNQTDDDGEADRMSQRRDDLRFRVR